MTLSEGTWRSLGRVKGTGPGLAWDWPSLGPGFLSFAGSSETFHWLPVVRARIYTQRDLKVLGGKDKP